MGCETEVKIVSVEPTTINFNAKTQSTRVKAQGLELRGTPIPGVQFTYRSDNTSVAEVSADGTVRPVSNGSATIIASTTDGKQGESFVKVCMPQELVCDPPAVLNLRVGTAAPIKCHLIDCKEETITGTIEYIEADKEALFKDPSAEGTFVGKVVGDTKVTVKGGGLEKMITVKVAEQLFAPGMGPGSGGGGGGGGNEKERRNKDPYNEGSSAGQFNHILKNM
ncbi:MAG: Ig-like domain-containing protein [Deltaproteobacteria bacterium]|nr:Ig-like domain-containing protein [Deltaproteobacteria bacterium]MBN2674399.1 Ig-like domain-containing protein [Deltaproteobacteria bacterium]